MKTEDLKRLWRLNDVYDRADSAHKGVIKRVIDNVEEVEEAEKIINLLIDKETGILSSIVSHVLQQKRDEGWRTPEEATQEAQEMASTLFNEHKQRFEKQRSEVDSELNEALVKLKGDLGTMASLELLTLINRCQQLLETGE